MLLTIHNLPWNITLPEIRSLVEEKCGISELILDKLMTENNNKTVTVGLSNEADAALVARKMNGLYMNGQQLYVENVTKKQPSEQPYRSNITFAEKQDSQNRYIDNYQDRGNYEQENQYKSLASTSGGYGPPMGGMSFPVQMSSAQNVYSTYNSQVAQYPPVAASAPVPLLSIPNPCGYNFGSDFNVGNKQVQNLGPMITQSPSYSGDPRNYIKNTEPQNFKDKEPLISRPYYMTNQETYEPPYKSYGNSSRSDRGPSKNNFGDNQTLFPNRTWIRGQGDNLKTPIGYPNKVSEHMSSYSDSNQNPFGKHVTNPVPVPKPWKKNKSQDNRQNQSNNNSYSKQSSHIDMSSGNKRPASGSNKDIDTRNDTWNYPAYKAPNKSTYFDKPKPFDNTFVIPKIKKNKKKNKPAIPKGQATTHFFDKDNEWRRQAGTTIAKQVMEKYVEKDKRITYATVLGTINYSVKSRINVLLGEKFCIPPDEIVLEYRAKFPENTDSDLLNSVVEKLERGLVEQGQNSKTEPEPKKQKLETPARIELKHVTNSSGNIPKYPNADKSTKAQLKKIHKDEFSGEIEYELKPHLQEALDKDMDLIIDLCHRECATNNNIEKKVYNGVINKGIEDLRKTLTIIVKKRILDIRTGLGVRIFYPYKPPSREALDNFLSKYGVISWNKSSSAKAKAIIATCDSYENYDRLINLETAEVENVQLKFKPLHITGPPSKVSRIDTLKQRRMFINNQIVFDDNINQNTDNNENNGNNEVDEMQKETRHTAEETGHTVEETGHTVEETGPTVEETGHTVEEPGHTVKDTGHTIEETGHTVEETGHTVEETGRTLKETGHTLEESGHTVEETGHKVEETRHPEVKPKIKEQVEDKKPIENSEKPAPNSGTKESGSQINNEFESATEEIIDDIDLEDMDDDNLEDY